MKGKLKSFEERVADLHKLTDQVAPVVEVYYKMLAVLDAQPEVGRHTTVLFEQTADRLDFHFSVGLENYLRDHAEKQ